jgi:virginiamycin B lyase
MGRVRYPSVDESVPTERDVSPDVRVSRRRADVAFAAVLLTLAALTVFVLARAGDALTAPHTTTARRQSPTATAPSQRQGGVVNAPVRIFPMPDANADLMQPAVDASGHVWFGQMGTNRLGRLDSQTGQVSSWAPPGGQYGIMDVAVAADGMIWFTEQSANYIGRFDPTTSAFKTYPLTVQNGHAAAPQDLRIDRDGRIWFTEVTLGAIGRLDPATGAIKEWPVPPAAAGSAVYPYGLALAGDGTVWFSELSGGTLGHLDPATGHVRLYHTPTTDAEIFSLAMAPDGRLWFSELQYGKLGVLDPRTETIRELPVPTPRGTTPNLYDVAVAPDGTVWAASMGQNAIVRYVPSTSVFTLFALPDAQSLPYGLTIDREGHVWFTADRAPTNYVATLRL